METEWYKLLVYTLYMLTTHAFKVEILKASLKQNINVLTNI
jgi:hypothetical protein